MHINMHCEVIDLKWYSMFEILLHVLVAQSKICIEIILHVLVAQWEICITVHVPVHFFLIWTHFYTCHFKHKTF